MSSFNSFLAWYQKSGMADVSLPIPLVETTALFILLTICLLFRMSRTGLVIAYLFVYRWGWSFCKKTLYGNSETMNLYLAAYVVFGVIILTFTIVGMLHRNHTES